MSQSYNPYEYGAIRQPVSQQHSYDHGSSVPYHGQYATHAAPQAQPYVPRTAINDLYTFLGDLSEDDRNSILYSQEFNPMHSEYIQKFMLWLLNGELGSAYINGNSSRQETAEILKLKAHGLYANMKSQAQSEMSRLQQENLELQKRLAEVEVKGKKNG